MYCIPNKSLYERARMMSFATDLPADNRRERRKDLQLAIKEERIAAKTKRIKEANSLYTATVVPKKFKNWKKKESIKDEDKS